MNICPSLSCTARGVDFTLPPTALLLPLALLLRDLYGLKSP